MNWDSWNTRFWLKNQLRRYRTNLAIENLTVALTNGKIVYQPSFSLIYWWIYFLNTSAQSEEFYLRPFLSPQFAHWCLSHNQELKTRSSYRSNPLWKRLNLWIYREMDFCLLVPSLLQLCLLPNGAILTRDLLKTIWTLEVGKRSPDANEKHFSSQLTTMFDQQQGEKSLVDESICIFQL